MSNELERILEKYSDKPWKWGKDGLSRHPNLTFEIFEKYPDKPWHWGEYGLSSNPNITPEWIEKYPDKPWDWEWISYNKFGWTSKETPLQYYQKRKTQTIQQTKKNKEELIACAWHPDRVTNWCFDVEELREINDIFC